MKIRRAGGGAGLFGDLVVDLFAGGGGASLVIERAVVRANVGAAKRVVEGVV